MTVSNADIPGVFGCKRKYINKKITCHNEVKKYIVNTGIYNVLWNERIFAKTGIWTNFNIKKICQMFVFPL